jgi:hypothetical protein
MRRNSFNYRVVNPTYILFGIALLYGILSPMFYYASPLFGLAFYFLSMHFEDEDYYLSNLLIFVYIVLVEINRGLFLFSFLLFFLLTYNLAIRAIKESLICKWCVQVIFVIFGYVGYYIVNLFLSNIFNFESISLSWSYLVFILTDIFLVFVLL